MYLLCVFVRVTCVCACVYLCLSVVRRDVCAPVCGAGVDGSAGRRLTERNSEKLKNGDQCASLFLSFQ